MHREHEETFYVLRGAVQFTSGTAEHVLTAGGLFTAPAGVPHGFGNASSDEPAQLLITVTYLVSPNAASVNGADFVIDGGAIKTV